MRQKSPKHEKYLPSEVVIAEGLSDWLAERSLQLSSCSLPAREDYPRFDTFFSEQQALRQFPVQQANVMMSAADYDLSAFQSPVAMPVPVLRDGSECGDVLIEREERGWRATSLTGYKLPELFWKVSYAYEPRDERVKQAVQVFETGRICKYQATIELEQFNVAFAIAEARRRDRYDDLTDLAEMADVPLKKLQAWRDRRDPIPKGCRPRDWRL